MQVKHYFDMFVECMSEEHKSLHTHTKKKRTDREIREEQRLDVATKKKL